MYKQWYINNMTGEMRQVFTKEAARELEKNLVWQNITDELHDLIVKAARVLYGQG
jgi:hypothetical protein